jgi:transcriptional/translational regulatory protein YebC/TACO1
MVKVDITDVETARKFLDFIDALEDDEDVQHVYHNAEISDDVMAALAGEE